MSDLPAGAELDRLVAERVMRWRKDAESHGQIVWRDTVANRNRTTSALDTYRDFAPSTNIAHAWEVVEKLIGSLPEGDLHIEHHGDTGWGVSSCYGGKHWDDWVFAKTLPLAICRAALKAMQS